ncbi:IucA/IucC family protein [Paenibacillus sp. LHD-117]|uniref:IucA/IucC family protein n=1 Tax=Paenibacillus sp. LHD-117 TaxID=3071412 RepID=UPI0027DEDFB4|nr:IucA/IucC family protein [Paenibacillus sp. LHD-117]MDQ6421979.1 IucA/IucC family protein [Paenibacillus sp. LHD-117]
MTAVSTDIRINRSLVQAASYVQTDLVNALLAEELLTEGEAGKVIGVDELPPALRDAYQAWDNGNSPDFVFCRQVRGKEEYSLLIPVEPAYHQPYRIHGQRIIQAMTDTNSGLTLRSLDLEALLDVLAACWAGASAASYHGESLFEQLRVSALHKALSIQAQMASAGNLPAFPASLLALERWSALRDRPFHPAAKAKGGWNDKDYVNYSAEYGGTFPLQWIAVKRDILLAGDGAEGRGAADFLLSGDDRGQLDAAMRRLGLGGDDYAALPVHPWQLERMLPREFGTEMENGACVPLGIAAGGDYAATSSVRSLAPTGEGPHVKLPLGIVSLGAIRSLPALYMTNGTRGQRLLEQLRAADQTLAGRLYLCDETAWWAYMPKAGDWFDDRPRHLSCQIRSYPAELLRDPSYQMVPMAALAVCEPGMDTHLFDAWMRLRGMRPGAEAARHLFGELCDEFLSLCMRMLRFGVLPEIHGQNVLVVLKNGTPSGIVLRDHDTVRLHLPWLERSGMADPGYIVKPGRPNSLYNETPEQLLFYLQTLGIQVNLYAIADSLAGRYRMKEESLWQTMRESLEQAVECAGLPDQDRMAVEEILFEREMWPWKQIITPLLRQQGVPGGSMPSGSGQAPNPFVALVRRRRPAK